MPETAEDKLNALVGRVGKVRRWLAALAIMKIAALCLIFASVYIGAYAWLDHRFNFGQRDRVIALILLLAGIAALLHRLTKRLLSHVSHSGAANYIENRRSFNQQLVTAMEYHENKQEYPYSKALAEHLVLRVDKDCSGFRFDSTVEKWQGYVLGAIILFGLATALFYVHDNYVYFSSYFAQLTNPAASVKPLSSTNLQSITEDIIAKPGSEVIFTAEIEGRTPDSGKLVLVKLEPDPAKEDDQAPKPEEMQVRPTTDAKGTPRFEASRSFSETGRFKYRFETDSASTDWHQLSISPAPKIEIITASVAMPKRPPRRTWVKPYNERIENDTLKVIESSAVALNVQATDKLKEVTITALDGKPITKQLNGAQEFAFHFNADRNGSLKFDLVNEQGLANNDLPDLQIVVKTDDPPKIKLICPEGDYLTTNVASVPITFEITDDFGLHSAKIFVEIPGHLLKELAIPIDEAVKSTEYIHTIELEKYELTVGDSVLFYAEATDIDTGSALANRTASSEVYFIEIRSYRQNWRPKSGGGPSQGGMPPPVELLNILEYTRAVLKKTWAIAAKPNLAERDRSALDSIDNDVRYCAEQLTIIRDDSERGFNDRQKAVLNVVLQCYQQASKHLAEHNATSAIAPEKDAYRLLRKFILELELQWNPPSSGQSSQPKKRDSVKLQEKPEFSQYEKERVEEELKKVQQELKKLTREQKNLKRTFENLLKQQAPTEDQNASKSESASGDPKAGEEQNDAAGQSDSQREADESQGGSEGQESGKDASAKGTSPGDSESSADARSGKQNRGDVLRSATNTEARLRMLQARQRALQQQVAQLKLDLEQLPESSQSERGEGRAEAQERLDEALARMDDFQEKLAEARYQTNMDRKKSEEAAKLMESARREMDMAAQALDGELTLSDAEKLAREAQKMAEQLAEDADALDESVTPEEERNMLALLEAAKRLLETMPEPRWTTVDQSKGAQSTAGLVFTQGSGLAPAELARQLARQFWSISIDARKRRQQLSEDEPSDVKFYGQENEFFENAAKFDRERVQE